MPRSKIELPEITIEKIKKSALEKGMSPSALIQQAISESNINPQIIKRGKINITWTEEHEKKLKEMASQVIIKRGSKVYIATKVAILEAILNDFIKREEE